MRAFFADGEAAGFGFLPVGRYRSVEKDHGRIETRQALWVTDLSWLNRTLREHWPKLTGVGMIERRREINEAVSMERAFYIGSQGVTTAESFAKAARSHWGIENSLHWVLDVTFREDDCRVRKDHAPHNFAALRKLALALLRQSTQYPKRSCAPAAKPQRDSPTIALHCSASCLVGKCDCPEPVRLCRRGAERAASRLPDFQKRYFLLRNIYLEQSYDPKESWNNVS